ncbi:hypothetical protein ACET3Z_013557 [Daucus carota]
MVEQLERTRREMAELKALFTASNLGSPNVSDKASCQPLGEEDKRKETAEKEVLDNEEDCVAYDHPPPTEKKVAFGTVFDDDNLNLVVHGVPLKPGHVRVSVDGHIQPDAVVPVPVPGEIELVREAVGSHVAWPRNLISLRTVVKKKRDVPQSKNKGEVQKLHEVFNKMKVNNKVPRQYKVLYKHVTTFMKASGESIPIPCDPDVFGVEKTIYILHENLRALLEFDMIGQAAIAAYMAHLHSTIKNERNNDDVFLYEFFDPAATFKLNGEFQSYVGSRLRKGNLNHIYFMPHNHNVHWILVVIWDGDVYLLNPLAHHGRFDDLEKALLE